VESVSRGREFLRTASKVAKTKPLVVLKGGVTTEGASAAMSHTGSLAGASKVVAGAFEQAGVIQAETVDELFDYGRALAYLPTPKDKKGLAIVTNGGGFGVISTDEATKLGLRLANFSNETLTRLQKKLPSYANVRNPLDLVGDADVDRYRAALQAVSADPDVGIILAIVLLQTSYIESDVVDAITESQVTSKKPIVVCTIGGDFTQILVKMLEENQIPSYGTPERATNAIYALAEYAKILDDIAKKEALRIG
jgi:acetyltransferase